MGLGKLIIFSMPTFGKHFDDDVDTFQRTFEEFGVDVSEVYRDLEKSKLKNIMREYRTKDLTKYSYVIVAISSEGDRGGSIKTSDDKHVNLNNSIIMKLQQNPTLENKPKLFILNTNRGKLNNSISISEAMSIDHRIDWSKTMQFNATEEGGRINGSIFVETFCGLLKNQEMSLQEVMRNTIKQVRIATSDNQAPNLWSNMTEEVLLKDL